MKTSRRKKRDENLGSHPFFCLSVSYRVEHDPVEHDVCELVER